MTALLPVTDDRSDWRCHARFGNYGRRQVNDMNHRNSRYDGDLEMFVDPPRKPNLARLRFLRWLGEQGRLEHALAGPPCGEIALASTVVGEYPDEIKAA